MEPFEATLDDPDIEWVVSEAESRGRSIEWVVKEAIRAVRGADSAYTKNIESRDDTNIDEILINLETRVSTLELRLDQPKQKPSSPPPRAEMSSPFDENDMADRDRGGTDNDVPKGLECESGPIATDGAGEW